SVERPSPRDGPRPDAPSDPVRSVFRGRPLGRTPPGCPESVADGRGGLPRGRPGPAAAGLAPSGGRGDPEQRREPATRTPRGLGGFCGRRAGTVPGSPRARPRKQLSPQTVLI